MKLNAAFRLMTADNKVALRKMVERLNFDQRKFFFGEFPRLLGQWFQGFATNQPVKVQNVAPDIEVATSEVSAGASSFLQSNPVLFEDFIIAWVYLRQIYPPTKSANKDIYRLTALGNAVNALKKGTYVFRNENQKKSLTSWTLKSTPKVLARAGTVQDVILHTKVQGSKHVLFDYESAAQLCSDMYDIFKEGTWKDLGPPGVGGWWVHVLRDLKKYRLEQEVAIYLTNTEFLNCTVLPVKR